MKLVNNFYSVKYTVHLNILLLQIIFIHENSKRYNLSWKSYLMAFTNSIVFLVLSQMCIFLNFLLNLSENKI